MTCVNSGTAEKDKMDKQLKEAIGRIERFDQEHQDGLEREKKALEEAKALGEELE